MVAGSLAPWALVGGTSLAGMAATVLGRALDKRLQCSNWGSRHLTKVTTARQHFQFVYHMMC